MQTPTPPDDKPETITAPGTSPLTLRIFVASPGDVTYERLLAREAIDQVRSERLFRGTVSLELIAWDQPGLRVPMEAGLTPQESIARGLPKPEECDLVIVILWKRMGTALPPEYRKPDGTQYLSGTEWEFYNALSAFRKRGKPSVWIYRRAEIPSIEINDPGRSDMEDQWRKVESFFKALVNPDGSLAAGVNAYDTPDDFRRLFEQHLRDWLTRRVEDAGFARLVPAAAEVPRWNGIPYPGLAAFTAEQAPIFFGRGPEIDELVHRLSNPKVRFVAVIGVSGSGKSSLVAAGLVPRLLAGAVGESTWVILQCRPGERGGDPFLSLAYALRSAMGDSERSPADIGAELRADSGALASLISPELSGQSANTEVLLFVDQFEELFTQADQEERAAFFRFLQAVADMPRMRVLITLRADFYARAAASPIVSRLLQGSEGSYPLAPPGPGALYEMINGPAQAAGLDLEEGLVAKILDDTGTEPGSLALMAFALRELYQAGKDDNRLTLREYASIEGVQGALKIRAEQTYRRAASKSRDKLDRLLEDLVEVNEQEVATRRRAQLEVVRSKAAELVDTFIEARLLVTGSGANGEPTIEVAHEALLTAWPRLNEWTKTHASALRARRDLEHAANEWDRAGRPASALRTGAVLQRYRRAAPPSPLALAYLHACVWRQYRRRGVTATTATLGIVAMLLHVWGHQLGISWGMAAELLLYRTGVIRHLEWIPETIEIQPGQGGFPQEFQMGTVDTGDDRHRQEKPRHWVRFNGPFAIGRHEVSFEQYDAFCHGSGLACPDDEGWGRGNRPVINVSWKDAQAYVKWLNRVSGQDYRLPSEAEWEYAARGGTRTAWWWGERLAIGTANCAGCQQTTEFPEHPGKTTPTGHFEPNPFGIHDTAGNVWEWIEDCWNDSYKGAPQDGSAWRAGDCSRHVLRGGSFNNGPEFVRSAKRLAADSEHRYRSIGFRLAKNLRTMSAIP